MAVEHRRLFIFFVCLAALSVRCEAMSASEWYNTCRFAAYASKTDLEKLSPEEILRIRDCKLIATRTWCSEGWEGQKFDLGDKDRNAKVAEEFRASCPGLADMYLGGVYVLAVKLIENEGGIPWYSGWWPAESAIVGAFSRRWPNCISLRAKYGLVALKSESLQQCIDTMMDLRSAIMGQPAGP